MKIKKAEFIDLVDGLFAFDQGCWSSGIKDPVKKEWLKEFMAQNSDITTKWLNALAIKYLLEEGRSLADIRALIRWLSDEMDIDY